jgi:hypothetical protein
MIRNDDLSAFLAIPQMIGRASRIRVEEAVFALLLSNPSNFWSSGNNNYISGASSALSIDSLTTAKAKFRNQVDPNGKPILVSADVLLGPPELEATIDAIIRTTTIIDGTATALQPNLNPHAGTLRKAISPYLSNTSITDQDGNALSNQSSTAWWLFAKPASSASLAVAFLDGQQTPTIENAETSFDTLGMQWRGYHDFGVGTEETVASVKSLGASE